MTEFNKPARLTAGVTIDITNADLVGANSGQRPDLLARSQAIYRIASTGVLYSSVAGQLVPTGGIVNISSFGVVGDGSDESTKVQEALNHLNTKGGGLLQINGEVIRCDTPLVGYTNTHVIGTPGSTLDFSYRATPETTGDGGLFVFRGTASAEILLTADAVYGTNVISVPDASIFFEGELIEVSMTASGSFNDTGINTTSGQLNVVIGKVSNQLVIDTIIYDNLPVSNGARVRKITPVENVKIEGITVQGKGRQPEPDAGDVGLSIYFGKNVAVIGCTFDKVDSRAVSIVSCYKFDVARNKFQFEKLGTNVTQVSYGVAYSSSVHGNISANYCINARHGVVSSHQSTAYANDYYGISRHVKITDNHITGNYGDLAGGGWARAHAGISTHVDAEYISITGNSISGCRYGVNVRSRNNQVQDNTITSCPGPGIYLSTLYYNTLISGNKVSHCGAGVQSDGATGFQANNLHITDNQFSEVATGIYLLADPALNHTGLVISGNSMSNLANPSSANAAAIRLTAPFTGLISNNAIYNSDRSGIRLDYGTGVQVRGNYINKVTTPIVVLVTATKITVTDNTAAEHTLSTGVVSNASATSVISGNTNLGMGAL